MQIDKDESKLLAESIGNVAQHYSVAVDPKMMAWAGLVGVCCAVYGPRLAAWRVRKVLEKKGEKKAPDAETPSNVTPLSVAPFQPGSFAVN